ncbi:MAG: sigma-70 family RNA polymerase sigma factor [Candidatus Gracilibacteria bacterium]|nr:sigma-70 family RNA polymerase sigma factor [Candidatus Gracilibacteria bacterium]MDD3120360.1 sigma-70 family RNA polymerase sigma factor [Candidatus Gracilibacteria bacterium]MDD4530736.1 sigma-70 family RNA polymerase sigma factor [Candidatus Gracilibacteria bacterium]
MKDVSKLKDEEVLKLVIGNIDYFSEIIIRYEERLLRYIIRISFLDIADAENLLQEVFIKVYKNIHDFDFKFPFSSWIYRIAHNVTIDYYRKNKKFINNIVGQDSEEYEKIISNIESDNKPDKVFENNENKEILYKALQKLKVNYKEVLILKFIEGKSYEEIGEILMISIGTVGTLINRAKKQLKEELEKLNFNL